MQDNFRITFSENGLFFSESGKKYKIPSKFYPIAHKKDVKVFTKNNTVDFSDTQMIRDIYDVVDEIDCNAGFCYTNSEKISSLLQLKFDSVLFYSGWVFTGPTMPKHHAWVVVRNNEEYSIIDSCKYYLLLHVFEEFKNMANSVDRAELARKINRFDLRMKTHEKIIIGKCPDGFLYIGSHDSCTSAKKTFNELVQKYPNHPSYSNKNESAFGASGLQNEIYKVNGKEPFDLR